MMVLNTRSFLNETADKKVKDMRSFSRLSPDVSLETGQKRQMQINRFAILTGIAMPFLGYPTL
jgi:hypothetical protein